VTAATFFEFCLKVTPFLTRAPLEDIKCQIPSINSVGLTDTETRPFVYSFICFLSIVSAGGFHPMRGERSAMLHRNLGGGGQNPR